MVGSKQLQQLSWKSTIQNVRELEKPIAELVEFTWKEAIGDLHEIFEFGFEKLSLEQVILMLGKKKLKYLLEKIVKFVIFQALFLTMKMT